jgi:hypothetical protein
MIPIFINLEHVYQHKQVIIGHTATNKTYRSHKFHKFKPFIFSSLSILQRVNPDLTMVYQDHELTIQGFQT